MFQAKPEPIEGKTLTLHCGLSLLKGNAANNNPRTFIVVVEKKSNSGSSHESWTDVAKIEFLIKANVTKKLIAQRGEHSVACDNATHLRLCGPDGEFVTLENDARRDADDLALVPTLVVKKGNSSKLNVEFTMPAEWATRPLFVRVRYCQSGKDVYGVRVSNRNDTRSNDIAHLYVRVCAARFFLLSLFC